MLIRLVYEVNPLKCPACDGEMKIVALVDHNRQPDVVERILRHGKLWRESTQRGPPTVALDGSPPRELTYDPGFFDRECA